MSNSTHRKAVSDKTILKVYAATGNSVTKTAKRVSRTYMAVRVRLQNLGKIAK